MADRSALTAGAGILMVLANIPAFAVGYPDTIQSPDQATAYFQQARTFLAQPGDQSAQEEEQEQ